MGTGVMWTFEVRTDDEELNVVDATVWVIERSLLSPAARSRVARYLADRYPRPPADTEASDG